MTDVLGHRLKLGVVTPSVNTVVQPEYDDMRPRGVTNHVARIHIPDTQVGSEDDLPKVVADIDSALDDAVGRLLTCQPDAVALGVSIEAVYGDPAAGVTIEERLRARFGESLTLIHVGEAIPAALRALGVVDGPLALLTPYPPNAEPHLKRFVESIGYGYGPAVHLASPSTVRIAHTPGDVLRPQLTRLAEQRPRAIVQFGANLPMARVAAEAERWLGLPVIAVNTATFWHALRRHGIDEQREGFGRLLAEA